jgi:hypothetical protein
LSISKLQYNNKKNEFIETLLKIGVKPNNYELNNMIAEFFDNKVLGMPYYAPIQQVAYEASNKEAYNHNFITLEEDLKIIFQANIEANNKAVAIQEYYDTEKVKVINAIQKLSLRVQNIEQIMNASITGKQYVQTFDDLYDVEYSGNSERNIPYTSSFVDLLQKKVYTEKSNTNINKINIMDATVKILDTNYKSTGNINSILTDTLDAFYIATVTTTENKENILTLHINLNKKQDINTVLFSFTSAWNMKCTLSVSDDGINFIDVYDISGNNLIEWNFPSKTISEFKITMIKPEPDGTKIDNAGNEIFEYYYVLKNISVANGKFESKSVFVSKPIEFDNLVNAIRLDATDMIYNNTRIDYFIGFDNGFSKIGWDAIKNHANHELFMFEQKHKICNWSIEEASGFGQQDPEALDLYRIYKIDNTINKNSIKVTPGYNMWSVTEYQKASGQEYDETFKFKSFDFTEYTDKCVAIQDFMDCEKYTNYVLNPNTLYVFTQYVNCSENKYLYNRYIRVMDSAAANVLEDTEQKVFINGLEVSKTGEKGENLYSFALKKGVNKIQIVIYAPSKNGAGVTRWLYHNINFKEVTNDVFAFPPMKYTNWYTLDKHMSENYRYYTIKDNYICVKCNPNYMVKSNTEDMGYFIKYYTLKTDMRHFFKANTLSFRIMAILHSNNPELSPELLNFRITGK